MNKKLKSIYVCTNCGETSIKWLGKCNSCNEWGTMVEDVIEDKKISVVRGHSGTPSYKNPTTKVYNLSDISATDDTSRIVTGIYELDRVLGGGIVPGSMVLLGGEPGAGKSTMLLQLCSIAKENNEVLYVTGEESVRQIKLRAGRLKVNEQFINVAAESDIDEICSLIYNKKPLFAIVDSIQTMFTSSMSSSAGSVSQVKECATRLLQVAKEQDVPVFIVGHVNKDGAIAGPKVMEHIVDTVLYFEGDKTLPYRILRAAKNRYGSTNEIGMFDMTNEGLIPIDNPSEMLLQGRPVGVSGSCVACIMEGTRPIMAEIQALATKTSFGTPRRATSGFDNGRSNLLLAILEKRAGYFLGNLDIYINVVGGLELNETACDLSFCLAVVSSLTDTPLPESLLVIGEVGLGGEVRNVPGLETRLREAQRIGFKKAIVPKSSLRHLDKASFKTIQIVGASYLADAIKSI